jgi:hypothetical protein
MLEGNSCEVGCPTGSRLKTTIDTQAAEIERLRASLDEAVGVLRQIADRAGDGRRTASLPVIAREARDFITKHGGGS